MKAVDQSVLKAHLEARLAELESRSQRIENRLSDPGAADWEENAQIHSNDEVLNALGDLTEHDIQEIRLALSRIEDGSYGLCLVCRKPIGKERLTALPFTATCVQCAQH
jgi:RNA polymerase-binding transcription factor DksA